MAATAYLTRAPAGIPGIVSRPDQSTIEPANITPYGTTGAPAAFGLACIIDAATGNLRVVTTGDTKVYAFLAKSFPSAGAGSASNQGLGEGAPPALGIVNAMVRGYMSVLLGGSTAAVKGGLVYVWISASSGAHVQGQVEAADPSSDGFVIPGAYFMGPADADGNVEIAFYIH